MKLFVKSKMAYVFKNITVGIVWSPFSVDRQINAVVNLDNRSFLSKKGRPKKQLII